MSGWLLFWIPPKGALNFFFFFFFLRKKVNKMLESTNIPILCTLKYDFNCAKSNWILYLGILATKQNKNRVHPNGTKGLKDDL